MARQELHALAARLEAGDVPDREMAGRIAQLVAAAAPDRPVWHGAMTGALGSTDAVLGLLAEALPSWSVHISGSSATVTSRWTCTIRETGVRDDDELIGVGKAETLAGAVAAALLKVIGMRKPA
jgi:hypothetical protein